MRKTLAVLTTVAAVGAAALTVPAPAKAHDVGPGLAFGLAAGALTAGAIAATSPYYYGGGPYPYYGPRWSIRLLWTGSVRLWLRRSGLPPSLSLSLVISITGRAEAREQLP